MYQIIDGKTVSAYVKQQVKDEVAKLAENGSVPALAVIIVGNDPASKVYVGNKKKACEMTGMKSIEYALTLTTRHDDFYRIIKNSFYQCGVDLIVLPNIQGSKINGATKKIGNHIMIMVNDRNSNSDSFWFTLFHEIGHVINGDFGVSFENESGKEEIDADKFAENSLIPPHEYDQFLSKGIFTVRSVLDFSSKINRDPGIILGRLQKEKVIGYDDWRFKTLRKKYVISYE